MKNIPAMQHNFILSLQRIRPKDCPIIITHKNCHLLSRATFGPTEESLAMVDSTGRMYGQWPGLSKKNLYEGRDLATVFPGTDFSQALPIGLFKSNLLIGNR
jgi:hypothetical protein